jgi:hypothetical protein
MEQLLGNGLALRGLKEGHISLNRTPVELTQNGRNVVVIFSLYLGTVWSISPVKTALRQS